jgi:hypothetical protein
MQVRLRKRVALVAIAAALVGGASIAAQHSHSQDAREGARSHPAEMQHTSPQISPVAQRQVQMVERGIARYADIEVAKREGWKPFGADEPLMGQHWSPPEEFDLDYQGSNARLDYARPNNLMYTEIDGEMVLTGAAFVVRLGPGEALPEGFHGDADAWHVHDFEKAVMAATEKRPIMRWLARWWLNDNWLADGPEGRARAAMVHVWASLPNPDGPFADRNRLIPLLKHDLGTEHLHHLSEDAAYGLELAAKDGCENAYGGRLWVADVSRRTKRRIMQICEREAEKVRGEIATHRARPMQVFAAAEAVQQRVTTFFDEQLTPEQRARIAAMNEHGDHGSGHDGNTHGGGHGMDHDGH